MKRLISLMLALALALSLISCAKKTEDGDKADPPNTSGEQAPGDTGNSDKDTSARPADDDKDTSADPADSDDDSGGPDGGGEPAIPDAPITAPHFARDQFPRLDGSTATAPLAIAMAALMLGESEEDVTPLISFSRTTNSYYNLLCGSADLLIAGEGSEEVYAERERRGFEWEQTPFAIDAFVFVVNENNPVDSITVEEARRIYTGEIVNWSELGGADEPIIPLQRNPEAGSQSLMEKLVMGGTPMMEPPKEYVASSMGGLMEAVRGYDASAGAIGYSVYYYAQEMRAAEGLKLLKLEGVEPEPEAIRSGAYPLTNPYYVVIPASAAEESPTRVIRDWLLGEDGQRLAAREGYVSVMDIPTSPRETLPTVGTRLFEGYTDALTPGDYGVLTPFAGRRVTNMEFAETGCVFGLMTTAGQVVVDPVYTDVWTLGELLVLFRVPDGEQRVAVAHRSGRWVTGFDYRDATGGDEGVVLYGDDFIRLLRADGSEAGTLTREELGLSEEDFTLMSLGPIEGGGGEWLGDKLSVRYGFDDSYDIVYYDLTEGKLVYADHGTWSSFYPPYEPEEPVIEGAWTVYDAALGEDAPAILELYEWNESENRSTRSWYYEDGAPIPGLDHVSNGLEQSVRLVNGLIEVLDVSTATYYDMNTMEVVFRAYLGNGGD